MTPFSEDSLRLICDSVLIRSLLVLQHATEVLERNGAQDGSPYIEEVRDSLRQIEAEVRRRDLEVPSETTERGFLQGLRPVSAHRPVPQ